MIGDIVVGQVWLELRWVSEDLDHLACCSGVGVLFPLTTLVITAVNLPTYNHLSHKMLKDNRWYEVSMRASARIKW